jgi:hypothetical protein
VVVLRDVSGAFDKVWHNGLRYKLFNLGIPEVLERLLSNFLADRQFAVRVGGYTGIYRPIESGVPQGSNLSPTLYNIFLRDISSPIGFCKQILYADDCSQIVVVPWRSKRYLVQELVREIERVNLFEFNWKVKTNANKFKIIPISMDFIPQVVVNQEILPTHREGKMLGLTITSSGYLQHTNNLRNKALFTLIKLYRFKNLATKTKRLLYLSLVRPLLEYPPIPLVGMSKTRMQILQAIQNKALSWIHKRDWRDMESMESLHELYNVPPLNQYLDKRTKDIWRTVRTECPEEYEALSAPPEHTRPHRCFPVTLPVISCPTPPPRFVAR